MEKFFIIFGIICLAVQIPVWIYGIIHRKEIKEMTDKDMKKKYPDWPNVKRPKTDFSVFPLNQYND